MNTEEQKVIKEQEQFIKQAQQLAKQNSTNRFLSFIIWCASAVTGILFLFYVPESPTKNVILSVIWIVTLLQSAVLLSTLRLLKIGLIKEKALSALVKFSLEKMKECEAIVHTTQEQLKREREEKEERIIQ